MFTEIQYIQPDTTHTKSNNATVRKLLIVVSRFANTLIPFEKLPQSVVSVFILLYVLKLNLAFVAICLLTKFNILLCAIKTYNIIINNIDP
jgi:hypothetical protein